MDLRSGLARISRRAWITIGVIGALAAAAALSAAWFSGALRSPPERTPRYVELAHGTYLLPKPDAIAGFDLVRHDETPFGPAALKGRWTFLIFGYTSCPDFCPTTLLAFQALHQRLEQDGDGTRDVQFVMVSVDPERDTAKLLAAYVTQFNPAFVGVTGSTAQVARLADSVGAEYHRHTPSAEGYYVVDHSTSVLLVNPEGQVRGVFAPPHEAEDLLKGFRAIKAVTASAP
jgi:protein SCO1/2